MMDPYERDKLYDWLERGSVDVWLRRMMKERLAELEAELPADHPLLQYRRPPAIDSEQAALDALDVLKRASGQQLGGDNVA